MKNRLAFFSQYPAGYGAIYLTVFFGNFCFYGLRAILMIYLTKNLLLGDEVSFSLYSTFMALAYLTPILGGYLADRFLGDRWSVLMGACFIASGCLLIVAPGFTFCLIGLSLVTLGTGFFKPSIVSSVGRLFPEQRDPLKDQAYTTFYTGMNLGSFSTSLACGWIGETWGWHYVFPVIAGALIVGIILFYQCLRRTSRLKGPFPLSGSLMAKFGSGILLAVPAFYFLLTLESNAWLLPVIVISALGCLGYVFLHTTAQERPGLIRLSFLMLLFSLFCSLFEQTGSSLTLFIEREVDRRFCSQFTLPTPFFQALIPGLVLLFAPWVNRLWRTLDKRKREISIFSKFAWGFLAVSLSFWILVFAISLTPADQGIPAPWIVLNYAVHVLGDLCIVPIGFAAVSKESPVRFSNMMMGIWMVCIACGHFIAGILAKGAAFPQEMATGIEGRLIYHEFFTHIALTPLIASLVIFLVRGFLRKAKKQNIS